MKYAYINPYLNKEENNSILPPSDDHLRYLKKIASVPYLVLEEGKKRKNVKFVSQSQIKRNSLSGNNSVTNFDIISDDTVKKKGKIDNFIPR